MKKENGYKKCDFEDLNPFDHCKPVSCEEKYFGKRNFFNSSDSSCVAAMKCEQNNDIIYDYETNECKNSAKILSEEDLNEILKGNFTNWEEEKDENYTSFSNSKVSDMESLWKDKKVKDFLKIPEVLRRLRRNLNEPEQSFSDKLLSPLLFVIKLVKFY